MNTILKAGLAIAGIFVLLGLIGALFGSNDTSDPAIIEKTSTSSEKTSDTSEGYAVKVISNTGWSGSVGGYGNSRTVKGHGNKVISIPGNPWTVVAVVQKRVKGDH